MGVWDEWRSLTRFYESTGMALSREHDLWSTLQLANPGDANVRVQNGAAVYELSLDDHRAAVANRDLLVASVLVYSYALAEAAACDKLGIPGSAIGGIESWGQDLLVAAGERWDDVLDGRTGVVEVAVVRNIIAHGGRVFAINDINRLRATGFSPLPAIGDPVVLDDGSLRQRRARLKSLLRLGGIR